MRLLVCLLLLAGCADPPPDPPRPDGGPPGTDSGVPIVRTDSGPRPEDSGVGLRDAGPPNAGDAGPPTLPVTIATWNLETFPKHRTTVERVATLITEQGLDLVGIQEISDPDAFDALAAMLPRHERVISFVGTQRVGFVYRTDRFSVANIDLLFTDDSYAFPRPPLTADITVHDDAGAILFDFAFVVVHLKAQIDDASRLRREAAITELDTWIQMRAISEPEIIVVGDFNDELTDPPQWNVFGPFLEAPERYSLLTLPEEMSGAYTYLAFESMIDHVLISAGALDEYGAGETHVLTLDRTTQAYVTTISDHRPVAARFLVPLP